jgi:hypothetical protein
VPSRNRIYPHPVLRNGSSDYADGSTFESDFVVAILGDESKDTVVVSYVLQLRNRHLHGLIDKGKAAFFISFYSSETLFKELIRVQGMKGELQLPSGAVLGSLEIESFIIAVTQIGQFCPEGLNAEYGNSKFEIEPGATLAIGERQIFPISFERRSFQDLIRVQTSTELDKNEYEISLASNVITINMGTNVRQAWELMSSDSSYRSFLFISIYKDTLVEALSALVSGDDVEEFAWARKLIETFEKVGLDISDEADFAKLNRAVLRLLGKKGIEQVIANVN